MSAATALALCLGLGLGGDYAGGGGPVVQPVRFGTVGNESAKALGAAVGTNRAVVVRYPGYIGSGNLTAAWLSFENFIVASGAGGSDYTIIDAYFARDGQPNVRVTFDGGSNGKVIPSLAADIRSDMITPAQHGVTKFFWGELVWWTIVVSVANTTDKYPFQYSSIASSNGLAGSQTYTFDPSVKTIPDQTGLVGPVDTTGLTVSTLGFPGAIVLGMHDAPARTFVGRGDSHIRDTGGASASFHRPLGILAGSFERAMADPNLYNTHNTQTNPEITTNCFASLNMGVFGSGLGNYSSDNCMPYYKYATEALVVFGTNDITTYTLATMQTSAANFCAALTGQGVQRIYWVGLHARTTSTDNWTTTANQTYFANWGPGGDAENFNVWLNTKVADGTLHAFIPWGRYLDPSNERLWRVNGDTTSQYPTADGTHPGQNYGQGCDEIWSYIRTVLFAVPSAISGLAVTMSDTVASLNFTGGAVPFQRYLIEYKASASGTWLTRWIYDYDPGWSFSGLTPATSYDFRITPWNYKGAGPTSATVTASTAAAASGLLLDGLTTSPTWYWAPRRVKSTSTIAMRIRRDKDGMERNVHYKADNTPDIASILSWCGVNGTVRVKAYWDQAGNMAGIQGPDTAGDFAKWPILILNGVPYTCNGKFTQKWDTGKALTSLQAQTGAIAVSPNPTSRTIMSVVQTPALAGMSMFGGGNSGFQFTITSAGKITIGKRNSTTIITSLSSIVVNVAKQVTCQWDNATLSGKLWWNGTLDTTSIPIAVTMASSNTQSVWGAGDTSSGNTYIGFCPEIGGYDGIYPLVDQQAIEADQKAYWGT